MSRTDPAVAFYDPATNDYRLADDPRCCFGWGPPDRVCRCYFGHACFRELGHPGKCWDAGDAPSEVANPLPCHTRQRPKDWDSKQRAECNR